MVPTYLNDCFAVLHPALGTRAALICGPLSDEALNAYRALVFLGESLAGAGIPTLRLAYHGTGDSAGSDEEPDRFARWLDSIKASVDWLRSQCGVTSVTLIGHRIGASLAARAACDIDCVDSLVLLSPVSGRQFLHELTLAARVSQRVWKTSHKVDDGTWFESHGLRIDHPTRDALMRLDIRKLPVLPAEHVLVLDSGKRSGSQALAGALREAGAAASFEAYDRLDAMQRDSNEAEVPHTAFARICNWIATLPAQDGSPRPPCVTGALALDAAREMPVRFGEDDGLFGIMSLPDRLSPDGPALLLVNTSANPRFGNGRITVDLARELAGDGIASLRMDAAGMGDSDPAGGELGRPYSEALTTDVLAAVAELQQRTGRPVVVMGICSGAYHALQAAGRDARVQGLILVNLQRFVWHEGDPSDIVRRSALRPNAFYLRSIFSLQAWYRLIRADFDVANLLLVFSARLLRRAIASLDPVLSVVGGGLTRVGRVRRSVRTLGVRGVPMLYVLGCNDPGVEELAEYFGRDGWRLRRQPNVTYRVLQDADHTLGAWPVRAALIATIRDWCRSVWGGAGTAEAAAARPEAIQIAVADWRHGKPSCSGSRPLRNPCFSAELCGPGEYPRRTVLYCPAWRLIRMRRRSSTHPRAAP